MADFLIVEMLSVNWCSILGFRGNNKNSEKLFESEFSLLKNEKWGKKEENKKREIMSHILCAETYRSNSNYK